MSDIRSDIVIVETRTAVLVQGGVPDGYDAHSRQQRGGVAAGHVRHHGELGVAHPRQPPAEVAQGTQRRRVRQLTH